MDAAATNSGEPRPSSELQTTGESEDPNRSGSGQNSTARYKLMSPAKLPISRSPCITIPPGLSPTSFLESPVLLSNMKVEASPTTGSLRKLQQTVHGSMASAASATFPVTTACFNTNTVDARKSSFFEFKPLNRSNKVPADFNNHVSKQSTQVEGPGKAQSFASSPLVETTGLQASHVEVRGSGLSVAAEKTSDDGYNWRKYGQKLVKGSEFPRSYYKCTHPNCEVKKLFERSHDGQITEIVYKGTHDHPKPQSSCRYSTGTVMYIQGERSDKASLAGRDDKASTMYGQVSHAAEPNSTPESSPVATNDDGLEGAGFVSNRNNEEVDDDDPFSKRRKMELGNVDITPVVKPIREPRVVVQTLSEVDILDDGYRWRKYGQKVVRGNPNPRSYYKCTNAGCPVRKHVERASHDPKAVITTYEGKHNHDVPAARNSSHDMAVPAATAGGQTRIKLEESDTISLDLGMGISSAAEHRSNGQGKMLHSELGETQTHASNSNFKFVHTTSAPVYFGVLNNSSNPYGSRDNRSDGPSLNHSSYPCPQSMGRILLGP
ncbi:probable WRKY transcription factor 20 isoform X2 [Glycine soja]|uniref:probable WRKY transcription factor 20 isoform X2 n=1 Tax=Glycine soja TaxID=3848 RepID=UPI00103DA894|nr:probable WRKY transcription factor 20 isoform X2 [Glycine soja]XP_040865586.1 probable WRKY transcription factor 20 isoform X2 [Glycine max]